MRQINFTKMEKLNGGKGDCTDAAGVVWGVGLVLVFFPVTAVAGIAFMAWGSAQNAFIC